MASNYKHIDLEEREEQEDDVSGPIWDPVAQIYKNAKVPENANVRQMIRDNDGALCLFGYGSLCWNPGTAGESALAHPSVTKTMGKCRGYRRAWAQRSTDHRGWPHFPGIVCTLLTEAEFQSFRGNGKESQERESLTEGLIYKVPKELVDECLDELDFREKGVSIVFCFLLLFLYDTCSYTPLLISNVM